MRAELTRSGLGGLEMPEAKQNKTNLKLSGVSGGGNCGSASSAPTIFKIGGIQMTDLDATKWKTDINFWDKKAYTEEVCNYLEKTYGTTYHRYAVGMLADCIDLYVICTKDIEANGVVITHKNGVMGKNHHVAIRNKALSGALVWMKELCLLPKNRKPEPKPVDPKIAKLLRRPFYQNE